MSKVSVCIVSFNTKSLLRDCLSNLVNYKFENNIEVLVLDNNSSDDSVSMLEKEFKSVKLVKSDQNLGFSKGQNELVKKSQGDYCLLLNPDTKFKSSIIDKQVEFMEENNCDISSSKILDFSGRLESNGGDLPLGLALISWLFNLESFGVKPNFHRNDEGYYKRAHLVGWVGGTFMMIKKDVFKKIGFLNEDYFMYFEDAEFCYRAKKANLKVMINPDVEISHKSGASSKNPKLVQWKGEVQNLIKFYSKNFGLLISLFVRLLVYKSLILRMVAYFLFGKFDYVKTYGRVIYEI